ncbi:hypothetical protein IKE84_01205 [Candidatus Saccharibacteria bacterium]|nr:hypothetical protein [Candidatus Saccharibacteria bacterium]
MTKIQITDDTDTKKAAKEVAQKSSARKTSKSTKKISVDTTVAEPKSVKKIKIEDDKIEAKNSKKVSTEKKSAKKVTASKKSKRNVKVEKTTTKTSEIRVRKKKSAKSSTEKSEKSKKSSFTRSTPPVSVAATHSSVQRSTALSRRYVKRPLNESIAPEKSEVIKIAEAPKPVETVEAPKPVEIKETPKPVEVIDVPKPVEVEETPKPVKIEEAPKPVEIKETPKPVEIEEAPKPTIVEPEAGNGVAVQTEVSIPVTTRKDSEPEVEKKSLSRAEAKKERQAAKQAKIQSRLEEKRARAEAEAKKQAEIAKKKAEAKQRKNEAAKKKAEARREAANKKQSALRFAARSTSKLSAVISTENAAGEAEMHREFRKKKKGSRIALALLCSAITVGALVAYVHFNMPDISVKVAAMQTGIDASYPDIIPRGYSLKNVSSDKDGEISMTFENTDGNTFVLTEEKTTWDSNALLTNYVKKVMSSEFSTMREQGVTIYSEGDSATWVSNGIFYKIKSYGKNLTKEQIRNLATSV